MTSSPSAQVVVPVEPQEAFTAFTAKMGQWWDALLTSSPATFTGIAVDPEGNVDVVSGDMSTTVGQVTVWEPFTTYEQTLDLAGSGAAVRLTVTFTPTGAGTQVRAESDRPILDADGREVAIDDILRRYAAFVTV